MIALVCFARFRRDGCRGQTGRYQLAEEGLPVRSVPVMRWMGRRIQWVDSRPG